jgi:hypothetical protein
MSAFASAQYVWLAEALLVALAAGLALALVVGVLLLTRPRTLFAVNQSLSRWIDTRRHFRALEQPRMVERFFYRHHTPLGVLIVLGAGYVLWRWAFDYRQASFLAAVGPRWAGSFDWLVAALEVALIVLHVLILAAGAVILVRPSLLKRLEQTANRWHAGPPTDRLDTMFNPLDRSLAVYPRLSGLILLVASGWSLLALFPVLETLFGR